MNIIGEVISSALGADSAVVALVGTRVSPNVRPQAEVFPCVVYSVISDIPENSLAGSSETRLSHARVQVDVYAKGYKEAQQAWLEIDRVLGNLNNIDSNGNGAVGWRENARDLYDNEAQLHRVSADYIFSR